MLLSQALVQEISQYALENFPFWRGEADRQIPILNLTWSMFYLTCKTCGRAVLNDRNELEPHWRLHVLAGEIIPKSARQEKGKEE